MICIVINDAPLAGNAFSSLINETDDLTLVASFSNIFEASRFMSKHSIDLIILGIRIDETKSYEFVRSIPHQTFVIFISEFPYNSVRETYAPNSILSSKLVQFQTGIDLARAYSKVEKKENLNIADNYFVIH